LRLGRSEQVSRSLVLALRRTRESRGISQSELSRLSGVSRAMINHLESGKRNPTLIVCHALASAMETRLAELLEPIENKWDKTRR